MNSEIRREVYVTKEDFVRPISYMQSTNAIPIIFNFCDYDIPKGATAVVMVQKPSGKVVQDTAQISENTITVDVKTQMFAEAGISYLQLQISKDEKILVTYDQKVYVSKNRTEPDASQSQNESPFFQELKEAADAANQAAQEATDAAGNLTPEAIQNSVNNYLDENPVSGMTDAQVQQLNKATEDIDGLSQNKINKNQGEENAGKVLVVGEDGNLKPGETPIKTDSTLTQSGHAADAKTTGDKLSSLSEDTNEEMQLFYGYDYLRTARTVKGFLIYDGTIKAYDSADYISKISGQIPCVGGDEFEYLGSAVKNANEQNTNAVACVFFKNYKPIGFDTVNGLERKIITAPDGATSVVFSSYSSSSETIPVLEVKQLSNPFKKIEKTVGENRSSIIDIQDTLDSSFDKNVLKEMIEPAENHNGYIIDLATGKLKELNTSYYVNEYLVSGLSCVFVTTSMNWGNRYYSILDENDNVLELSGTLGAESTFETKENEKVIIPLGGYKMYVIGVNQVQYTTKLEKQQTKLKVPETFKWADKKWYVIGDSLTEVNSRTAKHYFDYVSENTGIVVVNEGVSGTGYKRRDDEGTAFYQRVSSIGTDGDVYTIFGSFNDLGGGYTLGTSSDADTTTIAGCIIKTLDNLQERIPLINIGVISPTPWVGAYPGKQQSDDYVNMLEEICKKRSIPFLDLYHCSNLRPWDETFRELAYSKDDGNGVHPDETGHKVIAPRFKSFLETLLI